MIYNGSSTPTAYFHPRNSIQRQQSSILRSKVISIKTTNLLFAESSTNTNPQHKIKPNLDRQSPILIRRHRPTIENLSLFQQPSDINDVLGNQLQLTLPPHSASRNKSPRISSSHSKPLNYSKTIHESPIKHITINSKTSNSLQTHVWSPTLTEKQVIHNRISRPRSHSLRHYPHHKIHTEKTNFDLKQNLNSHLYLSSKSINNDVEIFKKTNVKDLVDEWEDPKSNVAVLSDEDDSVVTNRNCSSPTSNWQTNMPDYDYFQLPDQHVHRRPYSLTLPSVAEYVNDEFY